MKNVKMTVTEKENGTAVVEVGVRDPEMLGKLHTFKTELESLGMVFDRMFYAITVELVPEKCAPFAEFAEKNGIEILMF